jgi:hypothetical protein
MAPLAGGLLAPARGRRLPALGLPRLDHPPPLLAHAARRPVCGLRRSAPQRIVAARLVLASAVATPLRPTRGMPGRATTPRRRRGRICLP